MKMVMVCVRDAKAEIFMRPWFVNTTGQAIRTFSDEVNRSDKENTLFNHPSDFALYEVATFNDNDGSIQALNIPRLLIQATQVHTGFQEQDNYALPKNITAV